MWSILIITGTCYLLVLGLIFVLQDRLIFPAPDLPEDLLTEFATDRGIQTIAIPTEDGLSLYGWHNRSNGSRAVILFHGNAATLAGAWPLHKQLQTRGWDIISFAYRGYPGSPGSPSEAGIQKDCRAVWRYATTVLGYPKERVILHGRSLGGGAVGTIMNETSPAGIVLQSTFRSVREIASSSYPIFPISLLLRHPFDTEARARQVSTPTLILHSRADEIIPVAHGRQLAKAFPNATYVEVSDSPHNEDLIAFNADALTTYLDFIEELVPLKPN